ncbi:MAG: putative heme d1 biosynthesis radical SAM protein NirJ1 [Desulfotomaculum sp.]|nr:putative heme d1 biosynthesis radical SAM protein NirJ1 [Desulfotomaculum sp.]
MISVSRLLCGTENFGDSLRYAHDSRNQVNGTHAGHGPVVVWNITRTCNLKCIHCYSSSDDRRYENELTVDEGRQLLRDLVDFKVPVVLFSGGEPLISPHFFEWASYAKELGLRITVSTNGTLITPAIAQKLKEIGTSYVGISLDGIGFNNDRFRGREGAYEAALTGIRNCLAVGQKVGLRFTINRHNINELGAVFDLLEQEQIPRVCFYHLVYSGRATSMKNEDISHQEAREALDLIIERTEAMDHRGLNKEVLTVDNHADAVYIYLKLKEKDPVQAAKAWELLSRNGGNRSGIAIGQVDWNGNVHADQFTPNYTFGNVRKRKFSAIWTNPDHPLLLKLKNRKPFIKGRCARCKWLAVCNGNFRPRAEAIYNDFWAEDPACYLTDQEIGIV